MENARLFDAQPGSHGMAPPPFPFPFPFPFPKKIKNG